LAAAVAVVLLVTLVLMVLLVEQQLLELVTAMAVLEDTQTTMAVQVEQPLYLLEQ
jgi:hypothetical protein